MGAVQALVSVLVEPNVLVRVVHTALAAVKAWVLVNYGN